MERGSGLLVHISELPSRHGIGTFGKEARKFVRFKTKILANITIESH